MKRKYFICILLPSQVARAVTEISATIEKKYGIQNVLNKYDPHITLKIPFEADRNEIKELIEFLKKFLVGRKKFPLILTGFGHFNVRFIYLDVLQESPLLTDLQMELCNALKRFGWMTFDDIEPNGIPHITIAADDIKGRFLDIYLFIQKSFSNFKKKITVTEICILERKSKGSRWEILKRFKLTP